MDGFKAFWNGNTMMIGIALAVLAVGAAFLRQGTVATVLGMLSGTAFMWIARPPRPVTVKCRRMRVKTFGSLSARSASRATGCGRSSTA